MPIFEQWPSTTFGAHVSTFSVAASTYRVHSRYYTWAEAVTQSLHVDAQDKPHVRYRAGMWELSYLAKLTLMN